MPDGELKIVQSEQIIELHSNQPISPWLNNPYIHAATSANTRKAYQIDIKHYELSGGKLPASPQAIAHYLQTFAPILNARTLARRLIALRHWHTYQGFTDPTNHPAIQKTMIGIMRSHGKPKAKARALTPDELQVIANYLNTQPTLTALRDNALLQIGFFGAFRRSELVAIRYEHIKWNKEGIEILIPSSKTDQMHIGQYCVIPFGSSTLCPISALKKWLEASHITHGAIFRRIRLADKLGNESLTPLSVNHILKTNATKTGCTDIISLSSHSLRRGLATSAARAGAPLHVIMRAGRWKQTNTVMEYIEESERFSNNAALSVLQKHNNNQI